MDYPDQLKKDRANQLKDDNYKSSPENDEDAPIFDIEKEIRQETAKHFTEFMLNQLVMEREELLKALGNLILAVDFGKSQMVVEQSRAVWLKIHESKS